MMANKWKGLVWIFLALAGLTGCTSSSSHTAYVTLAQGNAIAAFRVEDHSGGLTEVVGSPFNAGNSPISILVHPSNKFAYVANQTGDDISLFTIDQSTGALTEVSPRTAAGVAPAFLSMDSSGHFLFAANQTSSSISVYSIDAAKGALTEIQGSPFSTGFNSNPVALAITPSAKFLYVASPNLQSVFGYSVTSGALQPVPNSPVLVDVGPVSLAVDPSEHFVYVANFIANTLSVLAIDPNSGALKQISGSPFTTCTSTTTACTANPVWVEVHPSGKFLYTANKGTNNVSVFSISSSTGIPTQITNSPFATGTGPVFASIDSTGRFLFVGNQSSRNITGFSINQSTGSLATGIVGATTSSAPTSMFTTK